MKIKESMKAVIHQGPIKTIQILFSDLLEIINKDEMSVFIDNKDLQIPSEWRLKATHYKPTRKKPLNMLFNYLDNKEMTEKGNFVDIGSGLGRVLKIASNYEFEKVKGIELDASLLDKSKTLLSNEVQESKVELININAIEYKFSSSDNLIFMYDPFDDHMVLKVLENIKISFLEFERNINIIFHCNLRDIDSLFEKLKLEVKKEKISFQGNDFYIYSIS